MGDHLTEVERDINFELSVGDKVREFRRKLGWSQQVLGDYANLERNQIRRIEGAKHSPSLAVLTSIARALGRQPFELLKTDHPFKVNKHLDNPNRRRQVTTQYIRELVSTGFLKQKKTVDEIVRYCDQKYDVRLSSSATSGVLKKFVEEGLLLRVPSKIKTRFTYQKI